MVRFALVGVAVALAAGCKGELNPSYCAAHRDDVDCLIEGVDLLDAPTTPECGTNADCSGNPNGTVCDTTTHRCVICIANVDETACPDLQVCGDDQKCHGCVTDGDCSASGVCLATQTCATADSVLYALPMGDEDECSRTNPCSFTTAVEQLTQQRHIIKLLRVPAENYTDAPITINEPYGVQIIGNEVTFIPSGGGDAITASGANLEILGLTIQNAGNDGVHCTAGVLTLQTVTIANTGAWGVEAESCNVTIKRSRISESPSGAIALGAGTHEIRNNFIFNNGTDGVLETGAIRVRGASGRVAFNTIVRTLSRSGGQRVGGVSCTEASSGSFAVAQNIVADWGDSGVAIDNGCTVRENFERRAFADARFVSTTDYHLTAQSPAGLVLDAQSPAMAADCSEDAGNIDDIDSAQPRPFNNFCDRGADEYRP